MSTKDEKTPETISGIDVMRGVGVERARPFWADAWHRVVIRRGAQLGLIWIGIIGFFAIFAPVIANGLPLISREIGPGGEVVKTTFPLWLSLTPTDILLLLGAVARVDGSPGAGALAPPHAGGVCGLRLGFRRLLPN